MLSRKTVDIVVVDLCLSLFFVAVFWPLFREAGQLAFPLLLNQPYNPLITATASIVIIAMALFVDGRLRAAAAYGFDG